jgi:hypothetical protein
MVEPKLLTWLSKGLSKVNDVNWTVSSQPGWIGLSKVHRKTSTGVDGGSSWGSSVHRPGSEDLHRHQRNFRYPPPCTSIYFGGHGGYFQKLFWGSKTLDITSEGLGEMYEGDSAGKNLMAHVSCAVKFFPHVERRVYSAQTRERGPSWSWAEIGPSGAVQTVSDSRRPLFFIFWSERRCADGVWQP